MFFFRYDMLKCFWYYRHTSYKHVHFGNYEEFVWKHMFINCYISSTDNQVHLNRYILTLPGNQMKVLTASNCRMHVTRSVSPSYSKS
jgi:hypothetical protein